MRIRLYRTFEEDNHFSMKRYADQLLHALRRVFQDDEIEDFVQDEYVGRLTGMRSLDRRLNRYIRIPRRAKATQGDVNHIVDHAESHLLAHLDPHRTVVTCHDIIPTILWRQGLRTMSKHHYWQSIRKILHLRKARYIITDSESTRRDLIDVYGINGDMITPIYLGLDKRFGELDRENCRAWVAVTYATPVHEPILLHVGGNYSYKNIEGLLQELGMLKDESWIFLKIGGNFTVEQRTLINHTGLQNRVYRIERVSDEDFPRIYNAADILLFPSLYEGFGWPPLEAMACGTPVVCSDRGSLKEVVGDSAWIINPDRPGELAHAVRMLLTDPACVHEMIARGKVHAAQFSWEKCARQTHAVYENVLM